MKTRVMVSAGSGPIEVRWFVGLLSRRIEAMCRDRGINLIDRKINGTAGAPGSVTLIMRGDAKAALSEEIGSHALILKSSRRGRRARKRWFTSVTVLSERLPRAQRYLPVQPSDLEITCFRAKGPGGQNVNKRNTAVRVHHIPSGLSVRASEERSQATNKRLAIDRLHAVLASRARIEERSVNGHSRLIHHSLKRGAPVRVYRLDRNNDLEEMK